jgi:hypothetical protein
MWAFLLGGDLNPILAFRFPLFSKVYLGEFPSGWKNDGIGRKEKCGILWSIGDVKNPSMTQFEAGMTYLRIRAARLGPAGLLKALMHPSI